MRTIEEICAVIDEIAELTKRYELMQYTEEIRNTYKAEKERIIKELEKEIVPTYLLCEADTYNKAIRTAIEIVKRGGIDG